MAFTSKALRHCALAAVLLLSACMLHVTPPLASNEYGDVTIGREVAHEMTVPRGDRPGFRDQTDVTPDFFWSSVKKRVFTRSVVLEETGDPPDLIIRRNEGQYPDGERRAVEARVALGTISWQPWDGTSFYILDKKGKRSQGRVAAIYARPAVKPSQTNRAGRLIFQTGRIGELTARDTVVLSEYGTVELQEEGTVNHTAISWVHDPSTGLFKKGNRVNFAVRGVDTMGLESPGHNETGMWLLVNRDGAQIQQRVEVGPPDSGGPGYRILRIRN